MEHITAERSGRLTLEHIFPKNPRDSWRNTIPSDKELSDFVYSIGNLSLLEKGKNRSVGNLSFEEKKDKAFSTSTLAINQEVMNSPVWTVAEIENRSRKFSRIARSIWRLDY
jgi:hypothetical protein